MEACAHPVPEMQKSLFTILTCVSAAFYDTNAPQLYEKSPNILSMDLCSET